MQEFEVTVLGCGSATPSLLRNPSAQLLNVVGRSFLIDCGEGTQMQMRKAGIKIQRISHVFISHLHGDHYLGLLGLIQTMHLLGRKNALTLVCPPELKEIIDLQNKHSQTTINYPIEYIFTNPKEKMMVLEDEKLEVYSFPLQHRINCTGFLFKEKPLPRNISKERLKRLKISVAEIHRLRQGFDVEDENGNIIKNESITLPPPAPRGYAYCSDTIYDETLVNYISGVNLLYHESTFLETEAARAKKTFHTTASQAATIAKKAGAKQLLLGHFSARYGSLDGFLQEACPIFSNTLLAKECEIFKIPS